MLWLLKKRMSTHEELKRFHEVKTSSDRSFGLVFFGFFALVGLLPRVSGHPIRLWALGLSAAFFLSALLFPKILHPLNRVWARFGAILNKVTNPIVMGILFYAVITPVALFMRLCGKNPLKLKFEKDAATYWVTREPPGPDPKSMARQF